MVKQPTSKLLKKKEYDIPESLIYEMWDNTPVYYRGYRAVLNGNKKLEDIMGCSSLQWAILEYILELLFKHPNRKLYRIATNEAGIHIGKKKNLASDIALFDKKILTANKISNKYANVPPVLAVEIDVKAELELDEKQLVYPDYINLKTQRLLDFGTQKVIWIFTDSKKVLIADKDGSDWLIKDWNQEIELWQGTFFNIGKYLKEEKIDV